MKLTGTTEAKGGGFIIPWVIVTQKLRLTGSFQFDTLTIRNMDKSMKDHKIKVSDETYRRLQAESKIHLKKEWDKKDFYVSAENHEDYATLSISNLEDKRIHLRFTSDQQLWDFGDLLQQLAVNIHDTRKDKNKK